MQSAIQQIAVCIVGIHYSDDHCRLSHILMYLYIPSVSLLCVGVMEETTPWRGPLGGGPFNALFPCDITL
jgi:hypothetical protein